MGSYFCLAPICPKGIDMLSKSEVFNLVEEILSNNSIIDSAEIADSIVEVLDENGLFEEASSESSYDDRT